MSDLPQWHSYRLDGEIVLRGDAPDFAALKMLHSFYIPIQIVAGTAASPASVIVPFRTPDGGLVVRHSLLDAFDFIARYGEMANTTRLEDVTVLDQNAK